MFALNPIVAMLKNTKTNTYHPILYVESPMPGPPDTDKPIRHKSKGHRTNGFPTKEEALASIETELRPQLDNLRLATADDLEWDGEGIPASVAFFVVDRDGVLMRAM